MGSSEDHVRVSGQWQGHYEQQGAPYRIVAELTQEGSRIRGQMTDLDNQTETALYEYAAKAGLPPGADEEIDRHLRAMLPKVPKGEITVRQSLPESSRLQGRVQGRFVQFTKTYQGECAHAFEIGDQGVRQASPGHAVDYTGQLSEDGMTLTGRWLIYGPSGPGGEGDFELRRTEGSP